MTTSKPSSTENRDLGHMGKYLRTSIYAKMGELLLLFILALAFIKVFESYKSEDLIYNQVIKWSANVFMLLYVWIGLKLRGDNCSHFGLSFKKVSFKSGLKVLLQSLAVFAFAVIGFMIGAIIMANIYGVPQNPNMSGYNFLRDNPLMLAVMLIGVYLVSSFGEEVIYRGFLIHRISELGLQGKTGNIITVLASAVSFGLVHYSWGIVGIVQTAFMGLALGISYFVLKKRLWPLILAHGYMDTILVFQMYFG